MALLKTFQRIHCKRQQIEQRYSDEQHGVSYEFIVRADIRQENSYKQLEHSVEHVNHGDIYDVLPCNEQCAERCCQEGQQQHNSRSEIHSRGGTQSLRLNMQQLIDYRVLHRCQYKQQSKAYQQVQQYAVAEHLIDLLRVVLPVVEREISLRSGHQCIRHERQHSHNACHNAVYTEIRLTECGQNKSGRI